MKTYHVPADRQRGAVLVLVMLFAATLTTLAYSSFSAVESNLAIARQEADALRAELAAQSGLEFGQLQLSLDSNWLGILGGGLEYAPDLMFTCVPNVVLGETLGTVQIEVTGQAGDGYRELAMRLAPAGGLFEANVALGMLGGDDDVQGTTICGDVLITDAEDSVLDWEYDDDEGAYVLGGPEDIEGSALHCSWVNGTVYKFTDHDYASWPADEVVSETPHLMPAWDLDEYLPQAGGGGGCPWGGGGSSDYVTYYNQTKIKFRCYSKPVVVINNPGKNLYVQSSNLYGGLVMWCPKDYDLRSGKRQTLKIKDSIIGSHCKPWNIGIIAPACEFQQIANWSSTYGFSMVNEVKRMKGMTVEGMFYVVNRVKQLRDSTFIYRENVYENLPPGIELENDSSGYSITSIGENLN